jgi:hypothetical protein
MKTTKLLTVVCSVLCFIPAAILSPGSSYALPVIQEVLYDGAGSDADDVFTEIFGIPGMNLEGWSLVGVNGGNGDIYQTVSLQGAVIPSDGILLIATSSAETELATYRDFLGAVDWQNGPDAIQLHDSQGKIIDALQYGDAGVNNAGEGTPAADVSAGWSLSRDVFGTDTNDNFADFMPTLLPTPGIGPTPDTEPTPVPEPGTLVLLTTSILGWIVYARMKD